MLSELASKSSFIVSILANSGGQPFPIHDQLSLGREILSVISSNDSVGGWFFTFANEKEIYESIQKESNSLGGSSHNWLDHRDDLIFIWMKVSVQTYGSQGRWRSTVLSLKRVSW